MLAWTYVLESHHLGPPCLWILRALHRSMIFVPAIGGLNDVDFPRRRGLLSWPDRCWIGNSQADAGDRLFTPRSIRKLSGILHYHFCLWGLLNALAKSTPFGLNLLWKPIIYRDTPMDKYRQGQPMDDRTFPKSPVPCHDLVGLIAYVFLVFYSPLDQGFSSFFSPNSSFREPTRLDAGRRF